MFYKRLILKQGDHMKRQTVRFYTDSGLYNGWQWLNTTTFSEARSWLRSGNNLKIGDETLNSFTSITKLLNIFPR